VLAAAVPGAVVALAAEGWVGPGRPVRLTPGGFPRPALRTRRATLTATGAPHVLPVGQPVTVTAAGSIVQGVGILLPR
jgi:hypothetical protein